MQVHLLKWNVDKIKMMGTPLSWGQSWYVILLMNKCQQIFPKNESANNTGIDVYKHCIIVLGNFLDIQKIKKKLFWTTL